MRATILAVSVSGAYAQKQNRNSDRPKLPYSMMGLQREEIEAYDSKGEPAADATAALLAANKSGWDLIHKYFPALGIAGKEEKKLHPEDPQDDRFFAAFVSEDAGGSPMPLLSIFWSLPESRLSGGAKALHDEITAAMVLDDYSAGKLDDLRQAVNSDTVPARTTKGVKCRAPKSGLSFQQALRLYAMTIALLRMETKWADKADSPPPDMVDFTNRFRHQLPVQVRDGAPTAMFLYRPGALGHPLSKEEFEERADVAVLSRKGTTFEVEQFPVYLTAEQKEWAPAWIEPRDEVDDTSLAARKFNHDWTRLDGPFLWYRPDQLNGAVIYRCRVKFQGSDIVVEAERGFERRGAVKRINRPPDYEPAQMTAFRPGIDEPAAGLEMLTVEAPRLEDQVRSLKRPEPYFSNGFRAWCAYGRWTSGLAPDGKTWVGVPPDEPRSGGPNFTSPASNLQSVPADQVPAQH